MDAPRLNLNAETPAELLSKLGEVDISVPLRTEGRSNGHRERYMAARLLATLADSSHLVFPLTLEHREKPDFSLSFPDCTIGIECVEAVPKEWAQIQAIRERDFPNTMIMLPMLKPGQATYTMTERLEIARGERDGPPWVGTMALRQWAEAQSHFIEQKTLKLRANGYSDYTDNWLLIQDEWPVPLFGEQERREASELCVEMIAPLLSLPAFSHIFVGSSSWLIRLAPSPVRLWSTRDLWS